MISIDIQDQATPVIRHAMAKLTNRSALHRNMAMGVEREVVRNFEHKPAF